MRKEAVTYVADQIESADLAKQGKLGFNMNDYLADIGDHDGYVYDEPVDREDMTGHNCNTVGCIGGWAGCLLTRKGKPRKQIRVDHGVDYYDDGKSSLGLTDDQADSLFHGVGTFVPLYEITQKDAVKVLRHLVDTGEVDWSIINDDH